MTKAACCILLSIAFFVPLAAWLLMTLTVSPTERARLASALVDPASCAPEPGERAAYALGCILLPCSIFTLAGGLRHVAAPQTRAWFVTQRVFEGLLAILGAAAGWLALQSDMSFFQQYNAFYEHPWLALPGLALAIGPLWIGQRAGRLTRLLAHAVAATACAGTLVVCLTSLQNEYVVNGHFTAVFDPVAQVLLGKNLLVDYGSQYGLYADFLAPGFMLIGLDVPRFTCVMGMLTCGSFAALWWVLSDATLRPLVACLGFLSLLFNGWMLFELKTLALHPSHFDPYFQYAPLRTCFPAGTILLYWLWLNGSHRWLYALAVFSAAGVLWNLDSGLVNWLAALAGVLWRAALEPENRDRLRVAARHLAVMLAALAAVVVIYAGLKFLVYGHWPPLARLADYQRIFYFVGFNMLPMPLPGAWMLVVLVYLAGIARASCAFWNHDRSPRPSLVGLISLLGLGLFSYYQGRSHSMCLILCWWPALVLLPLLLDDALDYLRTQPRHLLAYAAAGLLGWILVGSSAGLVAQAGTLRRVAGEQLAAAASREEPFRAEAELVRSRVPPGQPLLCLSTGAAVIHRAASVPSSSTTSLNQMLLVDQYVDLCQKLETQDRAWVYIDHSFHDAYFIGPKENSGTRLLLDTIRPRLHRVGETSRGCLYELTREAIVAVRETLPRPE